MKSFILLVVFFVFASAVEVGAENVFSSEVVYGPEEVQGSLSWDYLGPGWLAHLAATADGELALGLGCNFPELEVFDYNSFEAIIVDFQLAGGLVFVEDGVAEDYLFVSPVVQVSDWEERIFLRSEQVARFTKESFGWWDTTNQVFFNHEDHSFGVFFQTHHNGIFDFSFFGPLYKNRVSKKITIEVFLGINPEKEKMGGARFNLVVP